MLGRRLPREPQAQLPEDRGVQEVIARSPNLRGVIERARDIASRRHPG
jgi:hypothetical protein